MLKYVEKVLKFDLIN